VIDVLPGALAGDLVPGDPDGVERLAGRLRRFAAATGDASAGLTGLDSGHWSGQAADLFRAAVGPVPRELVRAGAAFAAAALAFTRYAAALRAGQAAATSAIRLVEQSTPDSRAADQEAARGMVERARAEVAEAAQAAATRLDEAAAGAPVDSGVRRSGPLPAVWTDDGTTVRVVCQHHLAHPDQFLAPMDDLAADVHFGQDHRAGFAGVDGGAGTGGAEPPDWQEWAGQGAGRSLGRVEPEVLAGLGIGAAGLTLFGRQRRERTAFEQVGLDESEIRRRRKRHGDARHRDGVVAPARSGRLRSADAWRTRLAATPRAGGTVHTWADPEANPLPPVQSAEAVRLTPADRQVSGVVLHTGPPADERRPGTGAR
jgi:hypothetical protein